MENDAKERDKLLKELEDQLDDIQKSGNELCMNMVLHSVNLMRENKNLSEDERILKLYHMLDDDNKKDIEALMINLTYIQNMPKSQDMMEAVMNKNLERNRKDKK